MTDRNNAWYQHEGLDRTSTILSILEDRLGHPSDPDSLHPSVSDTKSIELLTNIFDNISELYEHIGRWPEFHGSPDVDTIRSDIESTIMTYVGARNQSSVRIKMKDDIDEIIKRHVSIRILGINR